MLTLGIDLAAQDRDTGLCLVRWSASGAQVLEACRGAGDERILELAEQARAAGDVPRAAGSHGYAVGVDAPFGWPRPFARAVAAWAGGEEWPEPRPPDPEERRTHARTLRLRRTDLAVHERVGRYPLSVSTDKLGICAMRAVALLTAAGRRGDGSGLDRVGGPWFEVYPAAARRIWRLPTIGDKAGDRGGEREQRLLALETHVDEAGASIAFDAQTRDSCVASDDVLDALLCAFVARAAQLGLTQLPQPDDEDDARKVAHEGWIHLPTGGVADLFG